MKVLVTGAGGQVGNALQATAPGWATICAMGRGELDLTDPASISRAFASVSPDVVINAAAYTDVDRSESEEVQAFAVNAAGVAVLAEACAQRGTRLVHLSTDYVFDGTASRPYRPDAAPSPQTAYGRSKLAGEVAALACDRSLIVRTAWVYSGAGRNFLTTMLRLLRERDELRVVADQTGTPTSARALAATIWALVEHGTCGIVHCTDAGEATWHEFAEAIRDEALVLGLLARFVPIVPIATADYPTPARRPAYSVLDTSETTALLGRAPRPWRAELRAVIEELAHG